MFWSKEICREVRNLFLICRTLKIVGTTRNYVYFGDIIAFSDSMSREENFDKSRV